MTDYEHGPAITLGVVLLLIALCLVGIKWRSSIPPSPVVREGKVAARLDRAAHEEAYFIPIPHESCSSNGKTTSCYTTFTFIPAFRYVPESWALTIVGCPRLARDAVKTYCVKPTNRTITVSEDDYNRARIGADWSITS